MVFDIAFSQLESPVWYVKIGVDLMIRTLEFGIIILQHAADFCLPGGSGLDLDIEVLHSVWLFLQPS